MFFKWSCSSYFPENDGFWKSSSCFVTPELIVCHGDAMPTKLCLSKAMGVKERRSLGREFESSYTCSGCFSSVPAPAMKQATFPLVAYHSRFRQSRIYLFVSDLCGLLLVQTRVANMAILTRTDSSVQNISPLELPSFRTNILCSSALPRHQLPLLRVAKVHN